MSNFDPNKLVIERIRFSTTQGEVKLTYDGRYIAQYGDDYQLRETAESNDQERRYEWRGRDDAYWQQVASDWLACDEQPDDWVDPQAQQDLWVGPEFADDVSLEERWEHYAFEERNGMAYGSSF